VQFSQRMFCCPGTKFVQSYELRLNKKCRSEHFSPTNFERVLLKVFEMTFYCDFFDWKNRLLATPSTSLFESSGTNFFFSILETFCNN
jgi:hypothetical protein